MLNDTLVTNEVKDAAGLEVEFERISISGESTTFKPKVDDVANPIRLLVSHQRTGTGISKTRRSLLRFDKTITNTVSGDQGVCSAYLVLSVPEGILENLNGPKAVLAFLMSFLATTGAATTVLFDCTGNGAAALLNETL